jgi:hypothetical protein
MPRRLVPQAWQIMSAETDDGQSRINEVRGIPDLLIQGSGAAIDRLDLWRRKPFSRQQGHPELAEQREFLQGPVGPENS